MAGNFGLTKTQATNQLFCSILTNQHTFKVLQKLSYELMNLNAS